MVAVVVCDGGIAREIREDGSDVVRLPFNSDYSLRFKNLHSEIAVVSVEIDGQDVLDGSRLVVAANSTADLKGFLKGDAVHNSFRFIKKTDQIVEHRGDGVGDGFIRVSWKFEKPLPEIKKVIIKEERYVEDRWIKKTYPYDPFYTPLRGHDIAYRSGTLGFSDSAPMSSCNVSNEVKTSGLPVLKDSFKNSDEGLTVAGKDTHQGFANTYTRELETTEYSIVIHLLGKDEETGVEIVKPKLAKWKITCPTCGKRSTSANKFCPNCSTRLVDVT